MDVATKENFCLNFQTQNHTPSKFKYKHRRTTTKNRLQTKTLMNIFTYILARDKEILENRNGRKTLMKKNHGIQMMDLMMAVGVRISTMMANGNLMVTRDQMKMVNIQCSKTKTLYEIAPEFLLKKNRNRLHTFFW